MIANGASDGAGGSLATDAGHGFGDAEARHHEVVFRKARRHSRFVLALRIVLPLCVLACFAVYAFVLRITLSANQGSLQFGKIEITADDLKMKHPSYFGVTNDGGKYEVRAREAAVDFAMTGPIKLEGIDGDLIQATGVKTNLKSTRGTLDNKSGVMNLNDGVDIKSSDGMIVHLINAEIKTREHFVSSHDPVMADMPTGHLTAKAMELWTEKKLAHFTDDVTLRLVQQPGAATAGQPSIGFGGDAHQPVDIHCIDLRVDDLHSTADFDGQVVAMQGNTKLSAPHMQAIYEGQASTDAAGTHPPASTAATAPGGGAQLKKLMAYENVIVVAGDDRRLIAQRVDFDVAGDTALFTGNIELTQAKNVFRGGRLTVDRKAGTSRLDTPPASPKAPVGRVYATLVQSPDPAKSPATKVKAPAAVVTSAADSSGFGGFHSDPKSPVDIEADELDVNDAQKQAVFRGHVIARQAEYTITASEMIAHYSGQTGLFASTDAASPAPPKSATKTAKAETPPGTQLNEIETRGGTKIVSKDGKEADGDVAHFDVKANTVMMEGPAGVTLHQGQSYTQGHRLRMNLTSGEARIENSPADPSHPQVPTAAQLSIAAKAGQAPPAQPTACPFDPSRTCVVVNADTLKQTGAAVGNAAGANAQKHPTSPPPSPQAKPADPQWSAGTVYRSN